MRSSAVFLVSSFLIGGLSAQCLVTAGGTPAPLVAYTTYPAHDEGRTAPIDMQFGPSGFPMAGAAVALTHAVVESNGVIYLTDGTAPVGVISYGPQDLTSLRGFAGDAPRVFPMWHDVEGLAASWAVTIDQTLPGRFKVNWIDVQEYSSGGPLYSFSASLYDTGVVEFAFGALPALPIAAFLPAFTGVSIGNGVGTGAESSVDLTSTPSSGTTGLLFEEHLGTVPGISGKTVTFTPNGTGGYLALVTCAGASHDRFGSGCYATQSTFYQLWQDAPAAKAALDGNGMLFAFVGGGYVPTFLPGFGASFLAPSGAATTLTPSNDGNTPITSSVPVPIPGGSTTDWNVSANGILTAGTAANNAFDYQPTGADVVGAAAPALAFYCWHDYNPAEAGSGPVQYEEVGGLLCITWNAVECYGTPSPNPTTWQFQIDLTTGNVYLVWVSMNPATVAALSGDDTLVGCTLAGTGPDAGSQSLTGPYPELGPDAPPVQLDASPAPIINPSTVVDYAVSNLPEYGPGAGVYLSTVFLSLNELPGGVDLGLIGAPGCPAYIGSLDLDLGGQVTTTPSATFSVTLSNTFFSPGDSFVVQAIGLVLPNSLPNGQNAFGLVVSNAVRTTTQLF